MACLGHSTDLRGPKSESRRRARGPSNSNAKCAGKIAQEKRDFSLDATFPCARERTFFCARTRTTDVGAREMPRSVVTAGPLCNESEFAKKMARFANLDST